MSPAPGTRLHQYEILMPIGAGGMAEVYKARDGGDVAKLEPGEEPIRFAVDGKSLYLQRGGEPGAASRFEAVIERIDLATAARTTWKKLTIPPSATALGFITIAIAPEADAYAYSYALQQASDLFVVKGLR